MAHTTKVLLVDDDAIVNIMNAALINELNASIEVTCVANGQEAIDLIKTGNYIPNLILLDIVMPVKSGWDVLDDFEEHQWDKLLPTKIIMLSANDEELNFVKESVFDNVKGCISEPIDKRMMMELLSKHC